MLYCLISLWPVKMPIGYALCLNWEQKNVIETQGKPATMNQEFEI